MHYQDKVFVVRFTVQEDPSEVAAIPSGLTVPEDPPFESQIIKRVIPRNYNRHLSA